MTFDECITILDAAPATSPEFKAACLEAKHIIFLLQPFLAHLHAGTHQSYADFETSDKE